MRSLTATYGDLTVRFGGPVDAMDADFQRLPAYVLEFANGRYPGLQGVDRYALDGAFRQVVRQRGCVEMAKECYRGPDADWTLQGSLAPNGFFWPQAKLPRDGVLTIAGHAVQLHVEESRSDGRRVLTVDAVPDAGIYAKSRFTYDHSPFPLLVEQVASDGTWQATLHRDSLHMGIELAPIGPWELLSPEMPPNPSRLFPGDDLPLLGSTYSPVQALDALLANASAAAMAKEGCVVGYAYPAGGGWGGSALANVNLTYSRSMKHAFELVDRQGVGHWWIVEENRVTLLGSIEESRSLTVTGEDSEGGETGLSCAKAVAPHVSAPDFLTTATLLNGAGAHVQLFTMSRLNRDSSDYRAWSLPKDQEAGSMSPIMVNAVTGDLQWLSIPGGMEILAVVPAPA